jgi:hypothetical protein
VSRYIAFACVIARAGRYLLLAVLLRRYGSAVRGVLDRYLKLVAVGGMLLLVAGVAVLWLLG